MMDERFQTTRVQHKLASSIKGMAKFQSSDTSLASTCDIASSRSKFMSSCKDYNTLGSQRSQNTSSKESMPNKFKERRCAEESKFQYCQPKRVKNGRYQVSDHSSFLNSLLDRSSSIFSIGPTTKKPVSDLRQKLDMGRQSNAVVLFNESDCNSKVINDFIIEECNPNFDPNCKNKSKLCKNEPSNNKIDDSLVNINRELDSYLGNGDKSFNLNPRGSIDDDLDRDNAIPCFKQTKTNSSKSNKNNLTVPQEPKFSVIEDDKNVEDILNQILVISELIQPSDDELACRILEGPSDPLSICFDMTSNKFEIDYTQVPKNGLLKFTARCDFNCLALNHDQPVKISKNDKLQVVSCDGQSHAFGYKAPKGELLLFSLDKIMTSVKNYPSSGKRPYTFDFDTLTQQNKKPENMPSLSESGLLELDSSSVSSQDSSSVLNSNETSPVQSLGYFKMDFNKDPTTEYLCKALKENCNNLNVLSAEQGDIVCITNSQYGQDWCEGYLAKDPHRSLGLAHLNFIKRF